MGKAHATYSPSRLTMLAECPGWMSGPPSDAATRGTAIHDTIARMIEGRSIPQTVTGEIIELADRGFYYWQKLKAEHPGMEWHVEQDVSTGIPECYGTADLIGYDELSGHVCVVDWKSGYTVRKDAARSMQMKAYGFGAMRKYDAEVVTLQVIELESGDSSTATFSEFEVLNWQYDIKGIIGEAQNATPQYYEPFSGCKYCGRENCPSLSALTTMAQEDVSTLQDTALMSPDELASMLNKVIPALDIIDAYAGKLKQRAMALIYEGINVPGWAVGEKAGARKWMNDEEAEKILETSHGVSIRILSIASPAVIEKRLVESGMKKKDASNLLAGLTVQAMAKTLKKVSIEKEAA